MEPNQIPPGLEKALSFPLSDALFGRRSRRFYMGATIPDGPLAFTSRHAPLPLTEIERMMVLTAAAGNTGWHYLITHNPTYAPHIANYAMAAGGRTFPSAAGFHTSEVFFTDDSGVYMLATRDAPELAGIGDDGIPDVGALLEAHRSRIVKLADGRLKVPNEEPHVEGHNLWVANKPGSLLVIPVADLAQHTLANLCYFLQNGYILYDDLNRRPIPGLEKYGHLANLEEPLPLSFVEQWGFAEATTELAIACYAGALSLQAMGLGGWMFNGLNPFAFLGASGEPDVPGLGFRYETDERWALPNVTGLPGLFEAFCPPSYEDMRSATEALAKRKFGPGGPFSPDTPGPWTDSPKVRGSAQIHSDEFKECVALQAQYVLDTFGKFPGTTPTMFCMTYLQAHHLDLEFYDHYFKPGAYLQTHAEHMDMWHTEGSL